MGLLNSHQILSGARQYAGEKTYSSSYVKTVPAYTISGDTVSFTSGTLEVEGQDFPFAGKSLDFGNLGSLIKNAYQYVLAAVPKYQEPTDEAAAEALGLNYFVSPTTYRQGIAVPFISTSLKGQVDLLGGWQELQFKVYRGIASTAEISLFNQYGQAVERLKDPRYTLFPLRPIGFDFILAEVLPQNNRSTQNVFIGKDKAYFDLLKSQLGEVYTETRIETKAAADTFYTGRYYLIKEAFAYSSLANAETRTGGVEIDLNAVGFTTLAAAAGANTHIVSQYYSYPSNTPLGHEGSKPNLFRFLAKEDSDFLGRINPIYLDNPQPLVGSISTLPNYSPLTRYADPASLLTVSATVAAGITLTLVEEKFETYYN